MTEVLCDEKNCFYNSSNDNDDDVYGKCALDKNKISSFSNNGKPGCTEFKPKDKK